MKSGLLCDISTFDFPLDLYVSATLTSNGRLIQNLSCKHLPPNTSTPSDLLIWLRTQWDVLYLNICKDEPNFIAQCERMAILDNQNHVSPKHNFILDQTCTKGPKMDLYRKAGFQSWLHYPHNSGEKYSASTMCHLMVKTSGKKSRDPYRDSIIFLFAIQEQKTTSRSQNNKAPIICAT